MHLIPASWSHLHILVSVFPSVGLVFVLGFYVASLVTNNELMKRACLAAFGILGLLAIPTYLSGDGSMAALAHDPKISADRMDSHLGWSYTALTVLVLTGAAAWYELWRFRRVGVQAHPGHRVGEVDAGGGDVDRHLAAERPVGRRALLHLEHLGRPVLGDHDRAHARASLSQGGQGHRWAAACSTGASSVPSGAASGLRRKNSLYFAQAKNITTTPSRSEPMPIAIGTSMPAIGFA